MDTQLDLFQTKKDRVVLTNLTKIRGLQYIPNFITRDEEKWLLKTIDDQTWIHDLRRRVQHYGFKYDYKVRRVDYSMRLGQLPNWLTPLSMRLYNEGYFDEIPDQVIVNEYEPGQGITSHIDCEPCFEDTVVSVSLGSNCIMDFTHQFTHEKIPVLLEGRSAVILKGESRHIWQHGIPMRKSDLLEGVSFKRTRRVSLTFRKVII
jgi:alkylated DNA repair dioxygenase AlkB